MKAGGLMSTSLGQATTRRAGPGGLHRRCYGSTKRYVADLAVPLSLTAVVPDHPSF